MAGAEAEAPTAARGVADAAPPVACAGVATAAPLKLWSARGAFWLEPPPNTPEEITIVKATAAATRPPPANARRRTRVRRVAQAPEAATAAGGPPSRASRRSAKAGVDRRRAGAHRVDERGELEVLLADRLAGEDAIEGGELVELARVQFIA